MEMGLIASLFLALLLIGLLVRALFNAKADAANYTRKQLQEIRDILAEHGWDKRSENKKKGTIVPSNEEFTWDGTVKIAAGPEVSIKAEKERSIISPLPWTWDKSNAGAYRLYDANNEPVSSGRMALVEAWSRAAEIQLRTGWCAERNEHGEWFVLDTMPEEETDKAFDAWYEACYAATPWEALVAADEWVKGQTDGR